MRTVQVLYLRDTYAVCGPGKTILNTWRTISKERFSLVVCAPEASRPGRNTFLERAEALGARVLALPMAPYFDLVAVCRLALFIRRKRIEILQTHDPQTRRLGIPAAVLGGAIHVTSLHGWIPNTAKQKASVLLDRLLIRFAKGIIVMSDAMREQVRALGVPARKITVLHNSIVLDDYPRRSAPSPLRQELRIPAAARIVAIIGRISPEKGHVQFLEMARRVHALRSETRFLVVGDGPGLPALRSQIEAAQLEDSVLLTGYRSDVQEIYEALDVLVIPSSTEGLPNVLLEAFAFAKPVVASPVGGIPEVLTEGENGYLVDPNDIATFAQRVLSLLDDPELAQRMGLRGRNVVETRFNFRERTRRLERFYERILEGREARFTEVPHAPRAGR